MSARSQALRRYADDVTRITPNSHVRKLDRPSNRARPSSTFRYTDCNTSSASSRLPRQQVTAQAMDSACAHSSCCLSSTSVITLGVLAGPAYEWIGDSPHMTHPPAAVKRRWTPPPSGGMLGRMPYTMRFEGNVYWTTFHGTVTNADLIDLARTAARLEATHDVVPNRIADLGTIEDLQISFAGVRALV